MIQAQALINLFKQALSEKWGYIWGQAGVLWTVKLQQLKVNYMIKNFGENWKKNKEAKNNKYYNSALNGGKWIGHMVADCSGLFSWAFKELGGKIAHGSNSIYDKYCSKKGKITDDIRKKMKPGTAVFVDHSGNKSHIGLYVGNGKVIEASGVDAGVCTSNLSAGKWTYYGELKGVDYSNTSEPTTSKPQKENPTVSSKPTLRKGDKGPFVTLAQTELLNKGYDLGKWGVDGDYGSATEKAVKSFQKDNGLTQDGVIGPSTWAMLDNANPVKLYAVSILHLTSAEADAIVKKYPGAIKELEV